MKQIRKRLTYANVMSSIAVFLVVGGATAFAALGKNTVGTTQLKKNAVTTAKIKNHSLQAADFKAGQLPAGPRGLTGPAGPAGPAGKDAFGELIYVTESEENPNGEQSYVEADCPGAYHVTGGGIYSTEEELGQNINSSYPVNRGGSGKFGNTGWAGYVNNESGEDAFIVALAICAEAGKVSGP